MAKFKRAVLAANRISTCLHEEQGSDRFPVDVASVAKAYSAQMFTDPIVEVLGENFDGFEGMLKASKDNSRWMIVYNTAANEGRRRFTLAHEFGHYMLHREERKLFECGGANTQGDTLEKEADTFAVTLLMPMDDFRNQIIGETPSFELFSHLAERYGVSLMAAALRWIEISPLRAVLVASQEGMMAWASSTDAAYRTGAVFATRRYTIELPASALAVREEAPTYGEQQRVPARDWFNRAHPDAEVTEIMVAVDDYDYTLTLLLLPEVE